MRKLGQLGRPFGSGQEAVNRWLYQTIDEIQKASAEKDKGVDSDGIFNSIVVRGSLAIGGGLAAPQITASQNNYAPTGYDQNVVLRLSSDAAWTITGMLAPVATNDGLLVALVNTGSFTITLANESASSTAANRFALGAAVLLGPGGSIMLWYDTTADRWRPLAAPARPLSVAFAAHPSGTLSNKTGNGATYTLICDTEEYDLGGNYSTSTGLFTAPVTGVYTFTSIIAMNEVTAAMDRFIAAIQIIGTSAANRERDEGDLQPDVNTRVAILLARDAFMTAGDTAQVNVMVDGAAGDTVDILATSHFTGRLVVATA